LSLAKSQRLRQEYRKHKQEMFHLSICSLLPILVPLLCSTFIYPYFVVEVVMGLLFELLVYLF
jgi:hypothetical protein